MASARNVVLPGNPRYQPKTLQSIFGYDNLYIAVGEVEIATLEVLADIGVIPQEDFQLFTSEMRERILAIPTLEVDELERAVTRHDIADLLHSPERYIGSAREKALEIAEIADGYLERMNRQ